MTRDPPRLVEDAINAGGTPAPPGGSELARALRDAQGDVLSPDAVARVHAGLTAAGIASTGTAPLGAKLLATALRFRIGLGIAGLALGLPFAALLLSRPHEQQKEAAPPPEPAATVVTIEPQATPAAPDPRPAETPAEPPATGAPAPSPTEKAPPMRGRATAHPQPAAPSPREGTLLLEARRTLASDPARALTLIRAHEAEFPESQLAPERARIAAEAHRRLEK